MPMPRAILFDLDGVLVDSHETWFLTVEEAGRRFRGRPITREEFFPTFGQGTAADVPVFGLSCSVAELDWFYVENFPRFADRIWVNPQGEALLRELTARGVARAIVTNTVSPLTRIILDHAKLAPHFPVVACADQVARAKPAPDILRHAMAQLNVRPADAWMIGDSRYDREAARAAGVRFVGLKIDGDERIDELAALAKLE